jgi:hypothetical protein
MASAIIGKVWEPLPLLPLNPQPRLMINRLNEDEGFR